MKNKKTIYIFLSIFLTLLVIPFFTIESQAKSSLTDISKKDWYYEDIISLVDMGGIKGYDDHTFKPNKRISFGEFLAISIQSITGKSYKSPEGSHWAMGLYNFALEKGIIDIKYFKPTSEVLDGTLTREEMAYIVVNIHEKIGKETIDEIEVDIPDIEKASPQYKNAIIKAYSGGFIGGKINGFDPKGYLTRAEAVAVTMRLLDSNRRLHILPV